MVFEDSNDSYAAVFLKWWLCILLLLFASDFIEFRKRFVGALSSQKCLGSTGKFETTCYGDERNGKPGGFTCLHWSCFKD